MKLKILVIVIGVLSAIFSCGKKNSICNATYFGGQIINPKENFITLYKNNDVIEIIELDDNNNFMVQLDADLEGLFHFNHGVEYQYIYIEPKDSILIRLNTWDFDESLVFSGTGSEKNNFLTTLYLQNEKEERLYSAYYKLESDLFEEKTANSTFSSVQLYNQLKASEIVISAKFNELAQVAINYPIYRRNEMYSWKFNRQNKNITNKKLSEDYYDYRQNINLNSEYWFNYDPYYNYVSARISGIAMEYRRERKTENIEFLEHKLNAIINTIEHEALKNKLLHIALYNDFRRSENSCSLNERGLEIFMANCTDKKIIKKIELLLNDCSSIVQNNKIENFQLKTIDKKLIDINTVLKNKKTVVYFWSPDIISPELLISRIEYLENKFSDLKFIGINMNPSQRSAKVNHKIGNQYYLTKESSAHNFITSSEARTLLINQKGIVHNSFTYLSSPYLERQLNKLNNR
jgi:hypothetical protein